MRHGIAHRKLGRDPGHRKALLRNMMNALVRSERIQTTVAKAKEVRRLADRLITLGKRNTTHARRRAFSLLSDKETTEKVFSTLASRFTGREGGYTRIVRTGTGRRRFRMAILEYLPRKRRKGSPKRKEKDRGGQGKAGRRAKRKTDENGKSLPGSRRLRGESGKTKRKEKNRQKGKKKEAGSDGKRREGKGSGLTGRFFLFRLRRGRIFLTRGSA